LTFFPKNVEIIINHIETKGRKRNKENPMNKEKRKKREKTT
jgi:hypothetical protein